MDAALVVFGAAALVGFWITGAVVDRALRPLVLASIAWFAVAGGVLLLGHGSLSAVLAANADVANALVGVSFNLAIFTAVDVMRRTPGPVSR